MLFLRLKGAMLSALDYHFVAMQQSGDFAYFRTSGRGVNFSQKRHGFLPEFLLYQRFFADSR